MQCYNDSEPPEQMQRVPVRKDLLGGPGILCNEACLFQRLVCLHSSQIPQEVIEIVNSTSNILRASSIEKLIDDTSTGNWATLYIKRFRLFGFVIIITL